MTADGSNVLVRLSDVGQTVANPADDIRGRTVLDQDGEKIGHVADLLVDEDELRVRLLCIEHGGLLGIGATSVFVPVEAIVAVSDDQIRISSSRQHMTRAPAYDPELVDERAALDDLYGHYGYLPFWAPGYVYPPGMLGPGRSW